MSKNNINEQSISTTPSYKILIYTCCDTVITYKQNLSLAYSNIYITGNWLLQFGPYAIRDLMGRQLIWLPKFSMCNMQLTVFCHL